MHSVKIPSSEVVIYETQGNGVILLVKKASDQKYYLFLINSINGAITFDGIEGSSIFDTKLQALKSMQANFSLSMDSNPVVAQALVGAARYGPVLYILVVKQSAPIARIQNAHTIFSVTDTEFYKINLHFHPPLTQQEQRRIDRIVEFPVAEYHMWCETKDLTVPIYSDQHDSSFLWNKHWTKVFEDLGQKDVCIELLQGTANTEIIYLNSSKKGISRQQSQTSQETLINSDQTQQFKPTLSANASANNLSNFNKVSSQNNISRQSSSTGLQTEGMFYRFTIISIRESTNGGTRYYARGIDKDHHPANEVMCHLVVESNDGHLWSHIWRRGSIPIKWSTVLAKNLPTVSISIQPDSGSDTHFYFDYLKTFFPENIFCINLLHNHSTNSEYPLCLAYQSAVERLENISYIEFDWHKEVKDKGISGAVELLYCYLPEIEFTYSKTQTDIPIAQNSNNNAKNPIQKRGSKPSIFSSLSILFPNEISDSDSHTKLNLVDNEKVLLPEFGCPFTKIQKSTVRINCMDSLDRTNVVSFFYATKVVSNILEQIGVCESIKTYEQLMQLPLSIRNFLCESFLGIGDCVSYLYTNTPACMTEIFHEVAEDDIKTKSDSSIAVKRRYHNFLTDRKRQKAYNMFLGKCFEQHIPNVDCSELPICVSMGSAQFMKPFLSDGKNAIDPTNLLQISSYTINSVGCKAIIMLLSEICYVTDIYMIISPPNPPSTDSISSSLGFGMKTPLVEKVALPFVTKPQPVFIKIPPDRNNYELNMMRFLIFEFETRTVDKKMKFIQPDTITLSNIFVFGRRTCNPSSVKKYYNFTYQNFPTFDQQSKLHSNISLNEIYSANQDNTKLSAGQSMESLYLSSDSYGFRSASSIQFMSPPSSQDIPFSNPVNTSTSNIVINLPPPSSFTKENMKPDEVLKNLNRHDFIEFLSIIQFEDSRITHHYGRLQSLKIAALHGFNPLNFNISNYFRDIPDISPIEHKCSVCGKTSCWQCFLCDKHFCKSKSCSKQNYFQEAFFFKQSSIVCDQCAKTLEKYRNEIKNLLFGYKNFFALENQTEGDLNALITSFINDAKTKKIELLKQENENNNKQSAHSGYITELSLEQQKDQIIQKPIETDPSRFPLAFFIDTLNPSYNLLLTEEGWSISSEEWGKNFFCIALGYRLELTSLFVKGSNDCVIRITQGEGKSELMELKANTEHNCQGFCGRLFSINLVSGTLNSIYFKGKKIARAENRQKLPPATSNPLKLKYLKTKNNPINTSKIISTELSKDKSIMGVVLQSFSGIHSILIEFYKLHSIIPFKVIKRYIPETDSGNEFIIIFKKPVVGARVDIQVIDSGILKEPKVMLI